MKEVWPRGVNTTGNLQAVHWLTGKQAEGSIMSLFRKRPTEPPTSEFSTPVCDVLPWPKYIAYSCGLVIRNASLPPGAKLLPDSGDRVWIQQPCGFWEHDVIFHIDVGFVETAQPAGCRK